MQARSQRTSLLAVWWMILGEWRAHPARVIAGVLAIAAGVALGVAVHLVNASAVNELAKAVRTVNGDADLQVRSVSDLGFNEALYPKLAGVEGIAGASPVVEIAAVATGSNAALTLLGLDVLRAGAVTPNLVGLPQGGIDAARASQGANYFDESTIFLSDGALRTSGKRIGDTIALRAKGREHMFRIAGGLPGVSDGEDLAVIDIASAQWRFGQLKRLHRIDLRLKDNVATERIRGAIAAILPLDAGIITKESEARRTDNLSRAYRINLDMLALVALLTGAFLVYSGQSLSVTRRLPQFALLRVLGVLRRGVLAQLLAEGAVLGGIGSLAGLGFGIAIADGVLRLFGGDLGGGYFQGTSPELVFTPVAFLAFFLLGLAAAVLGSALPALEASRVQPAIALKNLGLANDLARMRTGMVAIVLMIAGVGAAMLPALGGVAVFGYLSLALLLAGGVTAMPVIARFVLAPLQQIRIGSPALHLARLRLWNAPSQAAIALCGIVASTSLMIAMAIMVASFRDSVDEWLTQVLPADVYLHVEGSDGGLDVEIQRQLARAEGVASIDFRKLLPLRLSPELPSTLLLVRSINRARPEESLPLIGASLPIPLEATPVLLSEPAAEIYGYRPGDVILLPIGQKSESAEDKVFVAGIWRDYARQQGAIAIDSADYLRLTGDALRTDGAVELKPGADARATIASMRAALPPALAQRVTFAQPGELRALSLRIFDRTFAITYALQAAAILIGLAGVAVTFSAQTLARSKEFGMLRHIGVSRGQVIVMLISEGALLGAIGGVAGIGLGIVMSQVLIHVINPQSFHWTLETQLPLNLFASVAAALIVAAAGTALFAGRGALSKRAVHAVREDW